MIKSHLKWFAVIGLVGLLAPSLGIAAPDVPPRTDGGQALVVPEAQLDLGEVYHVAPGIGTQFVWTSDAPLLRIMGTCNRVVGYFVKPFDLAEGDPPIVAGALRIPVASLRTGSELSDAEIHGRTGLNVAEYPEITLLLTEFRDAKLVSAEGERKSYTLTASGQLQVKDATIAVEFPMRLTLAPFTWQTMRVLVGDLLAVRASFEITLADVGLDSPQRNSDFSADVGQLDLFLLCSTVSPEKKFDPTVPLEQHLKQLRFLTQVRDFNDPQGGYELGRTYMREIWDDAPALNRLALATLTEDGIEKRDLSFIMEIARRANELTGSKDPEILNTLARAHYERGDLETTLKYARLAVEHLEGLPQYTADEIRRTLAEYEAEAAQQPTP